MNAPLDLVRMRKGVARISDKGFRLLRVHPTTASGRSGFTGLPLIIETCSTSGSSGRRSTWGWPVGRSPTGSTCWPSTSIRRTAVWRPAGTHRRARGTDVTSSRDAFGRLPRVLRRARLAVTQRRARPRGGDRHPWRRWLRGRPAVAAPRRAGRDHLLPHEARPGAGSGTRRTLRRCG